MINGRKWIRSSGPQRSSSGGLLSMTRFQSHRRRRTTLVVMFIEGIRCPPAPDRRVLEVGCGPGGKLQVGTLEQSTTSGQTSAPSYVSHARKLPMAIRAEFHTCPVGKVGLPRHWDGSPPSSPSICCTTWRTPKCCRSLRRGQDAPRRWRCLDHCGSLHHSPAIQAREEDHADGQGKARAGRRSSMPISCVSISITLPSGSALVTPASPTREPP